MSEEKNIFDLENTDDLPIQIKKTVSNKRYLITSSVIDLFNKKNKLSITEIVVGIYRINKIILTRQVVSTALSHLCALKKLKRIDCGVYEKI